jgi:hypothetical protein
LTENSKGNPCCAENFIERKNMKKNSTVHLGPKEAKKNKLYPTINYTAAQGLGRLSFFFSFILAACRWASLMKSTFQPWREGLALLKMKSFLYFHINHAPMIKISMKNLL